eukprot:15461631-Alexandrium_andersonii.AAC.1
MAAAPDRRPAAGGRTGHVRGRSRRLGGAGAGAPPCWDVRGTACRVPGVHQLGGELPDGPRLVAGTDAAAGRQVPPRGHVRRPRAPPGRRAGAVRAGGRSRDLCRASH